MYVVNVLDLNSLDSRGERSPASRGRERKGVKSRPAKTG